MIDIVTMCILLVVNDLIFGFLLWLIVRSAVIAQLNQVLEMIASMFTEPTVKKAMSVLGKKGAESRAATALTDQVALDILNSPKFSGIKMVAGTLGMDLDDYIEKHGAVNTISAVKQLGDMLGIDLMNMDLSTLASGNPTVGFEANGGNPYLR